MTVSDSSYLAWLTPERFTRWSFLGLTLYASTAALSIAVSQITIVGVLVLFLLFLNTPSGIAFKANLLGDTRFVQVRRYFLFPALLFLFSYLVSTLLGVNPLRAFPELFKTSLYLLIPIAILATLSSPIDNSALFFSRTKSLLTCLLFGQGIAAIHSIISSSVGYEIRPHIPGAVTESGQLVLVLSVALSLIASRMLLVERRNRILFLFTLTLLATGLLSVSWSHLTFWSELSLTPNLVRGVGASLTFVSLSALLIPSSSLLDSRSERTSRTDRALLGLGVLLLVTLLINLKRGPWFGVGTACLVVGLLVSPRLALSLAALGTLSIFAFEPTRVRLLSFADDFSIKGGRQSMWELGFDIIKRYPVGLGPDNAVFMRELDPTLPTMHRHMHNNFLNITVEGGWIGLICYCLMMGSLLVLSYRVWKQGLTVSSSCQKRLGRLSLCLGAGLLGWQVAGLVEYNFGDGEIRMLALLITGLILSCSTYSAERKN